MSRSLFNHMFLHNFLISNLRVDSSNNSLSRLPAISVSQKVFVKENEKGSDEYTIKIPQSLKDRVRDSPFDESAAETNVRPSLKEVSLSTLKQSFCSSSVSMVAAGVVQSAESKMVKGRQGERVRLYLRETILGYKRCSSSS